MIIYPPLLWIFSNGSTLAIGGEAIRWRLGDVFFAIPATDLYQEIDLAWLQLFINGRKRSINSSNLKMASLKATSPALCLFVYLINMFLAFEMVSFAKFSKNFPYPLFSISSIYYELWRAFIILCVISILNLVMPSSLYWIYFLYKDMLDSCS